MALARSLPPFAARYRPTQPAAAEPVNAPPLLPSLRPRQPQPSHRTSPRRRTGTPLRRRRTGRDTAVGRRVRPAAATAPAIGQAPAAAKPAAQASPGTPAPIQKAPAAAAAQSEPADASAAELANALQRRYDAIKDFSADFVHSYRGGALRKVITERGRLFVKKAGKMRWEYVSPEEKLFVSDGVKMYSYIPQDKQVLVRSVPKTDQVSTPTMFPPEA